MAHLSLSLLGTFRVTLDGEPVCGFESIKVRALLAYVAVESDRPHHRSALAGLLWPDHTERQAHANLRHALYALRKTIADDRASPAVLSVTRQTVQFNAASDCWLDVGAFAALVEAHQQANGTIPEALSSLSEGDPRASQLEQAVALYRGCFLEGLSVRDSSAFEDWALLTRERLQREMVSALQELGEIYAAHGETAWVCRCMRRWLAIEPWHEEAHRQLMRLLAQSGQRSAALVQYQACCRALADELDVEPTEETRQLYERIRSGEDLSGERALLFHNLPAPATPLVGRRDLLARLAALVEDPACRLLTLTGPGGSGKSRLALEVAGAHLEAYPDGVYWVALAPLKSSAAIVPAIAHAIGFAFDASASSGSGTFQQQLLAYLRSRRMLLVLDNAEHLPGAGSLADDILAAAPELKLLVTSRTGLGIRGEHLIPVRGMPVPPVEHDRAGARAIDGREYSAVELFVEGARRMGRAVVLDEENLEAVVDICRAVDGLPLGILLAAAWTQILSPVEIAHELENGGRGLDFLAADRQVAPARQQSMRVVFDHSWRLLSERARETMRDLSTFVGGCTREAAQQVTGASLRDLMTLVRRSLLARTPSGRYEMHELMRQYAAERLAASPDGGSKARARHAAYYAAALGRWATDSKGRRQVDALRKIAREFDNSRAAWQWAVQQGCVEFLLQALEGLCLLYEWRGDYEGGHAVCCDLVSRLEAGHVQSTEAGERMPDSAPVRDTPSASRLSLLAHALAWDGRFHHLVGQGAQADACLARSLALVDDTRLGAHSADPIRAFALLAMAARTQSSDLERARQLAENSLSIYRRLGDWWGTAKALVHVGAVAFMGGTYHVARQRFEESLAVARQLGDQRGIAWALTGLGMSAKQPGQLEEAERVIRESMSIAHELDDQELIGVTRGFLAEVLGDMGAFAEVRTLREEAATHYGERGDRQREMQARVAAVTRHLGSYDRTQALVRVALDMGQGSLSQSQVASYYRELGRLALAQGDYASAEEYMERSLVAYQRVGGDSHPTRETRGELVYVARALGRATQAGECLCTLLQTAVEARARDTALLAVVARALLLVDAGALAEALELYALAWRYPWVANSRWFEDIAGREIATATASLPPDVQAVARERGETRDLRATVEELLAECCS